MDLGLNGRTALVTGGSMGIGKAVALILASEGVEVVIAARHQDALNGAIDDIKRTTNRAILGIAADCSISSEIERLVDEALRAVGRIDILVNAIGSARSGDLLQLSDDAWDESLALKLMGQIRCCKAVVPHMLRQGWGRIVNISGTQSKRPLATSMPAGVANAGLVNFTKALAEMVGPKNILVNIVNPGPVNTRRIAYLIEQRAASLSVPPKEIQDELLREVTLGRFAEPREVAQVIAFLASEMSSFMSGAVIDVDGGYTKCL